MEKTLVVFDFDSTLMDGETIDFLASAKGCGNEVAKITEAAMNGELDFFESLSARVKLLEGLEYAKVQDICRNLPFINGAKECIKELKEAGCIVICFSGGFREATGYGQEILGYDAHFSNTLHHKNGLLTGLVGGEMSFSVSKGDMLERLQILLGITPSRTVAVGDGANDKSMFAHAGLKIAFCAKPTLKALADVCVDEKDLRLVSQIILDQCV